MILDLNGNMQKSARNVFSATMVTSVHFTVAVSKTDAVIPYERGWFQALNTDQSDAF